MAYPRQPDWAGLTKKLQDYALHKHDVGAGRANVQRILTRAERELASALRDLRRLPANYDAKAEPDDLASIRKLRSLGPRRLAARFDAKAYAAKVEGALLARMAGCVLGSIVEMWPIDRMRQWAKQSGDAFPPTDYWSAAERPEWLRYDYLPCRRYTRDGMDGVPVDDDIIYTLLGLLILEDFGPDFTTDDVGRAWLKYLPYACTAEDVALRNLKAGMPAAKAAEKDNPFCEWIGADIRSDPWGYAAAGWPERAAELAYRDAYLSHRRNGIYGEMFFSAAQAAAFAVDDPIDAIRIGLTEIPRGCQVAKAVRWALKTGPGIRDYRDARAAVDERFAGMHRAHTNNNACLTIFGLFIGGADVTKVIGQTVAMGLDNDCTTATAGSIVGAITGRDGIEPQWTRRFNNTVHSYLIGKSRFAITALVKRFTRQARRVWQTIEG